MKQLVLDFVLEFISSGARDHYGLAEFQGTQDREFEFVDRLSVSRSNSRIFVVS